MGSHWRVYKQGVLCYGLELESEYLPQKMRKHFRDHRRLNHSAEKQQKLQDGALTGPDIFKHCALPPASLPVCRAVSPSGWALIEGSPEVLLTCVPGGSWGHRNRVIQALVGVGFEWLCVFYQAYL